MLPQQQQAPFSNGSNFQHVPAPQPQQPQSSSWTPDPAIGHLLHLMRLAGPKKPTEVNEADAVPGLGELDPEEEYEFLEQLLQSRELNALVKAHNVILFCNQEQCPCVSNSCQIAAEVMEDVRPYALMLEECRELYAILSTPHIRVSPFTRMCCTIWF